MACEYCDIIQGKKGAAVIYSDDQAVAFLSEQPATIGHIIVIPKKHAPILEALGDDDVAHLFSVANRISIAAFEALKIEGTNIIVHNGIEAGQEEPHLSLNIVPRKSDDGMVFEWAPKQLTEEEMATIELQLKQELEKKEPSEPETEKTEEKTPAEEEKSPAPEAKEPDGKQEPSDNLKEKEENYLIKQLKRMP